MICDEFNDLSYCFLTGKFLIFYDDGYLPFLQMVIYTLNLSAIHLKIKHSPSSSSSTSTPPFSLLKGIF